MRFKGTFPFQNNVSEREFNAGTSAHLRDLQINGNAPQFFKIGCL